MHSNLSVAAMRRAAEVSVMRNAPQERPPSSPETTRSARLPLPGKSAAERERERERAQRVRHLMKTGAAVRAMAQNMASNGQAQQNGFVVETLGPAENGARGAIEPTQRRDLVGGYRKDSEHAQRGALNHSNSTEVSGRGKQQIGAGAFLARSVKIIETKVQLSQVETISIAQWI